MTTIDISKSLAIDGWMSEEELIWLAKKASTHQRIVEIGSWMGRSTMALAEHTPGRVWAVDTWEGSEELKPLLKDKPKDWLYETFVKNMGDLPNVVPVRMSSLEGSKALQDLKYDMFFIDAAHDYDNVKADIEAWRPLASPGALFCGHDYNWEGVKKAVNEFFPDFGRLKALSLKYGPPSWPTNSLWYTILP